MKKAQVLGFVEETPLFVPLFTGRQVEALYFAQVTRKRFNKSNSCDPYGHGIVPRKIFQITLPQTCQIYETLKTLSNVIYFFSDELYGAYVDINRNLLLNINIFYISLCSVKPKIRAISDVHFLKGFTEPFFSFHCLK